MDGAPFSRRAVAPPHSQIGGRFDLGKLAIDCSVLYLADTPEHAVAELLQDFRGKPLKTGHLRRHGYPLALVPIRIPERIAVGIVDACEAESRLKYNIRCDTLALPRRRRPDTQAVSKTLYDAGLNGFRWWSSFHGEWHSTVVFVSRAPLHELAFGTPKPLSARQAAVRKAARYLDMVP